MNQRIFATLLLSLLASTAVQAQTLRCGSQLISLGDRTYEVLNKCGEPAYRENTGYQRNYGEKSLERREEWMYGPRNGMHYYLRFSGGRLVKITSRR